LVGLTGNSDGRPGAAGARASVLFGLLSLATLPVAIAATRWSRAYELLDAAFAIPVALVFGALAVSLARRARRRGLALTLGSAPGRRSARVGRVLGMTGFLLGVTAAMAVGVYFVLSTVAD
jgi:hypothetical protein